MGYTVKNTFENATMSTRITFFLPKNKLPKDDIKLNQQVSGAITIPEGNNLIKNELNIKTSFLNIFNTKTVRISFRIFLCIQYSRYRNSK